MTTSARFTPSRAALAQDCLYSFRADVELPSDVSGDSARLGNAAHEAFALDIARRPVDLTALSQKWAIDNMLGELETLFGVWKRDVTTRLGWREEVALAYNPTTRSTRELGQNIERKYEEAGLRAGEIPMSLDVLSLGSDATGDYAEVIDWKTGQQRGAQDVEDHAQLRINALAAASRYGMKRAHIMLGHVTPDGVVWSDAWLDWLEFDQVAEEVRRIIRQIPGSKPKPGPWCESRFCQVRATCPKTLEAIEQVIDPKQLVPANDNGYRLGAPITTDEQADWTLTMAGLIEHAATELRKRVLSYADAFDGFQRADGKVYKKWPQSTRKIDLTVEHAITLLYEMGAGLAVKSTIGVGDVERLLGPAKSKEAFEKLRLIGALRDVPGFRFEARAKKA